LQSVFKRKNKHAQPDTFLLEKYTSFGAYLLQDFGGYNFFKQEKAYAPKLGMYEYAECTIDTQKREVRLG
jgi:hypothetical protein